MRDYDERRAYAFSANGPAKLSPRDENGDGKETDGDQRYRGPVLTGKVRCPNHPRSMRWAEHKPLTNCEAGTKCACGATITVKGLFTVERGALVGGGSCGVGVSA